MFEDFQLRHLPPLILATTITMGGCYPFFYGPEAALLKFGFPSRIAVSKAAHPVITAYSSRATTIGLALLAMYFNKHYEAMDMLLAAMGWMALVDGWVCYQDGAPGSVFFRTALTSAVSLWGLLGMTTGKWI